MTVDDLHAAPADHDLAPCRPREVQAGEDDSRQCRAAE
jgi:hypothetical protein